MARWGISSTGVIAEKFARTLADMEDAELIAVGSRTADRAALFADEWEVGWAGTNPDLAEHPDVEAVYVASPHVCHHDDTLMFLQAGKAVLCEKPFALSETQASAMTSVAELEGVFLMEALWSRFLPGYRKLGELLAEERIGTPRLVEADFAFRLPDDTPSEHRLLDPDLAGGGLLDLGVYPVNLAHLVFGEPETVKAVSTIRGGIDEQTGLLLGWPGGELALIHAGVRVDGTNTARIVGTEGHLVLQAPMHVPTRLRLELPGREPELFDVPFESTGFQYQVAEVQSCLAAGALQSEVMPHRDTLAIMSTLDRARVSAGLVFPMEASS